MQVTKTDNQTVESTTQKYLVFQLGNETYGVPLLQVQEIRTYTPATRIPNVPEYVLGVINLRGSIIAVIDLRSRFGLPEANEAEDSIVVVVNIGGKTFGLRVDSVSDVVEIGQESIQPPPTLSTVEETQRFISGLAQVDERVFILIELNTILDLEAIGQFVA